MPSSDRLEERDPTWNPPNPDPDPDKEGSSLQQRLEAETEAVLEQADRGWGVWVVLPKWWNVSDAIERLAGIGLFVLILGGGLTQLLWVRGMDAGAQVLTYMAAMGGTWLVLWCFNVMLQRRVYGRRRSRAERKSAARERVLKQWQSDPKSGEKPK